MTVRQVVSAFLVGAVFAVGLGLAGMMRPGKVIAFLDFAGAWDPSLALVMAGGIGVYALAFRPVVRRPRPAFALSFQVPTRREITPSLVVGAALFGVGWGLAGYCPGPAIASLATGRPEVAGFLVAMSLGSFLAGRVRLPSSPPRPARPEPTSQPERSPHAS